MSTGPFPVERSKASSKFRERLLEAGDGIRGSRALPHKYIKRSAHGLWSQTLAFAAALIVLHRLLFDLRDPDLGGAAFGDDSLHEAPGLALVFGMMDVPDVGRAGFISLGAYAATSDRRRPPE